MRLPYIVITCARIDSIKRVCSEPPCWPGAFLDLLSIHDSEAQHGKDICDRKTATMKQHARRFVAQTKTDILIAADLKKALESNGGVKGWRVSVVEMPQSLTSEFPE